MIGNLNLIFYLWLIVKPCIFSHVFVSEFRGEGATYGQSNSWVLIYGSFRPRHQSRSEVETYRANRKPLWFAPPAIAPPDEARLSLPKMDARSVGCCKEMAAAAALDLSAWADATRSACCCSRDVPYLKQSTDIVDTSLIIQPTRIHHSSAQMPSS